MVKADNTINKKSASVKRPKKKVGILKSTPKYSAFPDMRLIQGDTLPMSMARTIADLRGTLAAQKLLTLSKRKELNYTKKKLDRYKSTAVDLLLNCKDLRDTIRSLRISLTAYESGKSGSFTVPISNIKSFSYETKDPRMISETTPKKTYKNIYDFDNPPGLMLHRTHFVEPTELEVGEAGPDRAKPGGLKQKSKRKKYFFDTKTGTFRN